MDFLAIIGLVIIVYHLFYFIVPWFLDCDIQLAFKEKYGKPIESLRGKVVWITGASSGIGEHLAYALAKAGCKLVLSARRENELQRVKQKCLADNPGLVDGDVLVQVLDVSEFETHEKAFKDVLEKFGTVDVLVNNAGRSQRALWEDIELSVDREMFDLNVFGVVVLSRLVLRHFIEKGCGHLAVTSSFAGVFGVPFSGTYTASKYALHGYFESLRSEKIGGNISITILCPGPVQTNFLAESFTAKSGEKFGQQTAVSTTKVSAERCGQLFAVALANKIDEGWIAQPKLLQLAYLIIYHPNLARIILKTLGPRYLLRLRDAKVSIETPN